MTRIDVDHRALHWNGGSFTPHRELFAHGEDLSANPVLRDYGKVTWSARLIVGFKRRGKRAATLNQLVRIVRTIRTEQTGNPSSTFLSQRGIYRHDDSGEIVDEPGAQVLVINMGANQKDFEEQMTSLAETIAHKLDQAEVIVEIQRNGVSKRVFGVAP